MSSYVCLYNNNIDDFPGESGVMADQLRLRGGPTAQAQVFVGAEREVTVDTGLRALRIHDGVTPGGHLVELSTSAAASRSVVAVDATTAREALRVALEAAVATAEANRAAAVTAVETGYQAADAATLTSANSYTDTAISDLLGGSPDLLNTLNELAEAIGDDADFITTINNTITAETARVDALIASDMWLFASQADFPAAAANHGRVVHSHADGAMFYAHAGSWVQLGNNADLVAANTAITTGDAATLASANAYTDTSISNLTNGADDALDTLKEIGDALAAGDTSVVNALTAQITTEGTTRAAADTALSDRLDVLEADPTSQTLLDAEGVARSAAITTEETARVAADAATLTSANNYTDTQVASGDAAVTNAMTALVTTETAARGAADSALSARIDVLEADPTTATALTAAVAGVQADVDQNEADSDAAISAEEVRALAAEASITATHIADEAARNQLNLHAGLAFGQLYVGDLVVA
jgi:hypothetical protein